jgi:hypothetical protein
MCSIMKYYLIIQFYCVFAVHGFLYVQLFSVLVLLHVIFNLLKSYS